MKIFGFVSAINIKDKSILYACNLYTHMHTPLRNTADEISTKVDFLGSELLLMDCLNLIYGTFCIYILSQLTEHYLVLKIKINFKFKLIEKSIYMVL